MISSDVSSTASEPKSRSSIIRRVVLILIPIVTALAFAFLLFLMLEGIVFKIVLGAMIGYTISPFGPEIVIPAGVGLLYDAQAANVTALLIFAVVFVDVLLALFVLLNFEAVKAIPKLGPWIGRSEEVFSRKLKRGRETLALSGLVLYVAMPFQGSGGFVGSIMGRVVGLNRYRVFLAVTIGSALGAVPIGLASYYGMGALISALQAGADLYKIIGILIIIIFIIVVVYILRKEKRKRNRKDAEEDAST